MHRHNGENMRCMQVEPPVHEPVDPSSPQDHLLPAKLRNASAARGGWAKCSNNCKKLQLVKDTNMSQESYLNFCRSRLFFNKSVKTKWVAVLNKIWVWQCRRDEWQGWNNFDWQSSEPGSQICRRCALERLFTASFLSVEYCWVLLSAVEHSWVLLSTVECCSLLCFNQNIKYGVKLQKR